MDIADIPEEKEALWETFFIYRSHCYSTRRFDHSFTTNGIDVSLKMIRKQKTKPTQRDVDQSFRDNLENFTSVVSGDPGLQLSMGMTKFEYNGQTAVDTVKGVPMNTQLKSSTLKYNSGEVFRTRRLNRWCGNLLRETATQYSPKISSMKLSCTLNTAFNT